ncbi:MULTISPECIES: alpha/beta hydrolase [unclassified Mycobacterium]|uniref:alpha/beta fold hydrolase n=1 Tax=unclassified Mycobacterium TaxID=2642494 RepID=UPI0007403467|nr:MULTISPECIES: alpha/beta hydrolase [unclassified Mycobacterium]KUH80369.1 alpha/beta hydrolase [Mycobacterium sp. GA-0227b]KUH81923.1 alpha/beta hydrolase [Mycobacterium sp. GA-1999]KUH94091.1 alpha/beta hydrolase [Mycobacterium sp. IS-1556]
MTVVLVHGNPETDAVWGPLVEALGRRDVVRLSPPGFGAPLPSAFSATFSAYRDWLIDELRTINGPVELVGHDWGGCHVVNAVMQQPDLVRSWASDTVGLFDPEYVWHDMAQVFQTSEAGEQVVEAMIVSSVEDRAQQLTDFGIPADVAKSFAAEQGPEMAKAILALYRSARQPALADAGRALENAAARPGLSLLATEDPYVGSDEMRRRAAGRAGARTEVLDGLGHWWMVEDPARGAAALNRFWSSLD